MKFRKSLNNVLKQYYWFKSSSLIMRIWSIKSETKLQIRKQQNNSQV